MTVDLPELGFDADDAVAVAIDERDETTVVEVEHDIDDWTLTFNEDGELTWPPGQSAPRWLGLVIKTAAPELRVTRNGHPRRSVRRASMALHLSAHVQDTSKIGDTAQK
ncbi:hypothetical protein ACFQMF_15595 [Halorubrum rutilum]|uniref:Uncharacterized protein n=1 Tax=Halorubrum rutilum TaxID=1364933 RepID=A0ABD6ANU9_9EURY|nr:hypothetical protein [Halorubrum rutilum]